MVIVTVIIIVIVIVIVIVVVIMVIVTPISLTGHGARLPNHGWMLSHGDEIQIQAVPALRVGFTV